MMIGYHNDWLAKITKELDMVGIAITKDWYGPTGWSVVARESVGSGAVVSVQFSRPREPSRKTTLVMTPIDRIPTALETA